MRKKLFCLVLTLALLGAMMLPAYASDPTLMTDISGHWAEADITEAMTDGLFNGISDTAFNPDGTMTRGMFVTVLGRMAGVAPEEFPTAMISNLFSDVDPNEYYAPYVFWAVRNGIVNGMGNGTFAPNSDITREQMSTMLVRYASNYNYCLSAISADIIPAFSDAASVSDWASSAVEDMRLTGILRGRPMENGTYIFDPQATATRAEGAAVFIRLKQSLVPSDTSVQVPAETLTLTPETATLNVGQSMQLTSIITPDTTSNKTVTWISDSPEVISVDMDGNITALAGGSATIYAYTHNGLEATCIVTGIDWTYANSSMTRLEKELMIFGEDVADPRNYYTSNEEALANMVSITIKAWDFADSTHTTKITKQYTLTVHKNIAETVKAIFDEIYNGAEQFPINSVGCYRWEPGSEHMPGLAIDINPNENYFCYLSNGQAIVGSHWKPGEDPYSIPLDGEVAQIFSKYGFSQGIWSTKADYMHFSFFGT